MSRGTRHSLGSARHVAESFGAIIAPAVERWEIAGSIRRGEESIGDIEMLAMPKVERDLFGGQPESGAELQKILDKLVQDKRAEFVRKGRSCPRLRFVKADLEADLTVVHDWSTWGVQLAIRTGPAAFSQKLVTSRSRGGFLPDGHWWAKQRDENAPAWHLMNADGRVNVPEETDFLRCTIGGWIEPPERTRYIRGLQDAGLRSQASPCGDDGKLLGEVRVLLPLMAGKRNAMSLEQIARRINRAAGSKQGAIRQTMRHFLLNEGIPVIGGNKGFYVASSDKEINECLKEYKSKAALLDQTIQALNAARGNLAT